MQFACRAAKLPLFANPAEVAVALNAVCLQHCQGLGTSLVVQGSQKPWAGAHMGVFRQLAYTSTLEGTRVADCGGFPAIHQHKSEGLQEPVWVTFSSCPMLVHQGTRAWQ